MEKENDMKLTVSEAANRVPFSAETIYKACQRGTLKSTWFGKQREIWLSDLLAWASDPTLHQKGRRPVTT